MSKIIEPQNIVEKNTVIADLIWYAGLLNFFLY